MVRVDELFNIQKPSTLTLISQEPKEGGIPFVSTQAKNNGIAGYVVPNLDLTLYPAGAITCPTNGTILEANVQPKDFYCAHQIAVLTPKCPMSLNVKLYYCLCLRENKFRFSYGRKADRTLHTLLIPSPEEIPDWVETLSDPLEEIEAMAAPFSAAPTPPLDTSAWEYFNLVDLFELKRGDCGSVSDLDEDSDAPPMISASAVNTGICGRYQFDGHLYPANSISIANDGSIGEAFYRPEPFHAQTSVSILIPKFDLTPAIALFIIPVLQLEKFRYTYGRKWGLDRMKKTRIKLPVEFCGAPSPDYEWMDAYIKTLPFSSCLG